MALEIINRSGIAYNEADLEALIRFGMEDLGLNPECDLEVLLVDEEEMTQLHVKWMDELGPTDVLTFPMDELRPNSTEVGILGDIVLCPQVAIRQAESANHTFIHEMSILGIHGLLHIVGYDHATKEDEVEMFARQESIVARWSK
jgi:probable rRNA maturation factor